MKVAIDFDNTLADSIQVWHNILINTFPEKKPVPKLTDLTEWNLGEAWGLNSAEKEIIFNIFRNKGIKYCSPRDANFYKWIVEMQEDGHELYILTANPASMKQNIEYWLAEFNLTLPIQFVDRFGGKFAHDFDVLVEDCNEIIENSFWKENPDKALIIYNNPWNESCNMEENMYRAYNWRDVLDAVNLFEWVKDE